MGFLGEFRKLLFGVKSVSKSGAEKVVEKSTEIGEDILDKGNDLFDSGVDKAKVVGDKIGDKLSDLKDSALEYTEEFRKSVNESPTVDKAADFTENVGEKVIEKTEKLADFTEDVGAKVIDKGSELSEKLGAKANEVKDKLVEKAEEITKQAKTKFDETYEKAKALEAQEALEGDSEFADTPLDAGGSLIEDTDDFFARADKYAKGNYSGKQDNVRVDKTEPLELPNDDGTVILKDGDTTISKDPTEKKVKELAKAAGFEDLDGDGNEVVDDAIIVESDDVITDSEDVTDVVIVDEEE